MYKRQVLKLLKLSGLPSKCASIPVIQQNLSKQLDLINKLHTFSPENSQDGIKLDPNHARIMPRSTHKLTYKELMEKIEYQKQNKDPELGEVEDGSWNATETTSISRNGYFVFRHGFIHDGN